MQRVQQVAGKAEFGEIHLSEEGAQQGCCRQKPIIPARVDRIKTVRHILSVHDLNHRKLCVRGQIIAVPGGVALIGQFQVVAINLVQNDGLEPGHVLAVYQRGETVRDARRDYERVKMPDEHAGTLMVFRTFARVSYALVLKATRTMHVDDIVTNP